MEVDPQFQAEPRRAQEYLCAVDDTGQKVPLSAFTHYEQSTTPLAVAHQGQFPAVTFSFNLAPECRAGRRGHGDREDGAHDGDCRRRFMPSFQGTAQAFQDSLASEPYLILAALVTVYIVLGMLYENYIHPITILSTLPSAGVGALAGAAAVHDAN